MLTRGISNFSESGSCSALFGTMGFFSAGALHLSTAATVNTLTMAAAAGFSGGLTIYCPLVALRLGMHYMGLFNEQYKFLIAMIDLAALALAMPLGAYMLGLAIQPFLIAAVVSCTLYGVFNFVDAILRAREMHRNPPLLAGDVNPLEDAFTPEYARYDNTYSEESAFAAVSNFC